jgi:hypothetical protein
MPAIAVLAVAGLAVGALTPAAAAPAATPVAQQGGGKDVSVTLIKFISWIFCLREYIKTSFPAFRKRPEMRLKLLFRQATLDYRISITSP